MSQITEMIQYYIALLERRDLAAYLSLALAGLILALGLCGALKGAFRGIGRQAVRLMTIGASVVLAFFATRNAYPIVVDFCEGKTMLQLLALVRLDGVVAGLNPEIYQLLSSMDATAATDVLTLPMTIVILPFVFAGLFVLISTVMLLIHACIAGILGYAKNNNNALTRILGAILGFVQGALVAVVLLIPVSGLINIATEAVERSDAEDGKATVLYEEYIAEAAQSPVNRLITKYGGELVYQKLTTVSLSDSEQVVDTRESVYNILIIYDKWMSLESADFSNLNAEQREALSISVEILGEDPYIARMLASIIRSMVSTESIRYTLTESFEEPFRGFFNEWLSVYEDTTAQTVKEDLDTVLDVLFIMMDNDLFAAFSTHDGEMMRSIFISADESGDTVIEKIVSRFNENPRTAGLVTTLARLSLTLMAGESDLTLDSETLDTFNEIKTDLSDTILALDKESYGENTAAYEEDVAQAIDATLTENGIELAPDVTLGMAKYVSENNDKFKSLSELDDAALCDILISYYLALGNTIPDGNGTNAPSGDDSSSVELPFLPA